MQLFTHGQWWSNSYSEKKSMCVRALALWWFYIGQECWSVCLYASHLHTVVTHAAVWAARRSVEVARGTPLHPHLNSLYLHVFIKRSSEVIVFVFVLIRWETDISTCTSALCVTCLRQRDLHYNWIIPLGKTPGSMKVAMLKLANTNRKTMPLYRGTTGEMALVNHGHLRGYERNRRRIII